jgi:hypothetical protein
MTVDKQVHVRERAEAATNQIQPILALDQASPLNQTERLAERSRLIGNTVVNNQFSGARKVRIGLLGYLFRPNSYLYRFSSYPIKLDISVEVPN